jgi:hypothetical protein
MKQKMIGGMNEFQKVEERQAITRALIENEVYLLKVREYNPHTGQMKDPEVAQYEIHPTTP